MNTSQEAQLLLSLIQLNGKMQRKLGRVLSAHGLGLSEFLVLSQLANAPNQTMRRVDLADMVGLTPSGVTRLLNPMDKIGLIEKTASSRDARVSLVAMSSAGKRTFEEAGVTFHHTAQSLFGSLDAQRKYELGELIQALT